MGKLTTHVLDTAHGRPGAGIAVRLYRCSGSGRALLLTTTTNADGRFEAPQLEGAALTCARFELEFALADYLAALGLKLPEAGFVDVVTLHFGIADAGAHYHVPLLASPFSYSTYRGS